MCRFVCGAGIPDPQTKRHIIFFRADDPPLPDIVSKEDISRFVIAYFYPPVTGRQQLGILYDFNDGARLLLPAGNWRGEISDDETGNILFADDVGQGGGISTKK